MNIQRAKLLGYCIRSQRDGQWAAKNEYGFCSRCSTRLQLLDEIDKFEKRRKRLLKKGKIKLDKYGRLCYTLG